MSLCRSCQDPATVRLFLITLMGLWNIVAKAEVCSCEQYRGCNPCPSSGTCTRINVALNKSASSSRLYSSTVYNEESGPPCLAVNGDTNTTFRPINRYPDSPACVHTDPSDLQPYWEVDLGQQFIISTITVYGREEAFNTLRTATVTVDDRLCYTFVPDYLRPTIAQITCSSPLTGKTVRIQKVNDTDKPYFIVCQIQVWVCRSGYYDPNCTNTCGNCSGGTCDPSSGECPQGCSAGYQPPYCNKACTGGTYGDGCTQTCGNCRDNRPCNIYDGRCETECLVGYKPPLCKEGCSSGFYGINCTNTCGNCSGGACDLSSGECPQGCTAGYVAQYCKEKCRPGTFGAGCYNTCGSCAQNSLCNIYDGRCETGCSAGFKPPLCNTCLQYDDHQSTNTAGPIAGAVVGSICGCVLGFLLGVLFMRYRHRQGLDKRSSATDFSAPLQTVHNQEAAGVSSTEPASSLDYENTNVSTNVYDSLKPSRDDNTQADYTSLPVKKRT